MIYDHHVAPGILSVQGGTRVSHDHVVATSDDDGPLSTLRCASLYPADWAQIGPLTGVSPHVPNHYVSYVSCPS